MVQTPGCWRTAGVTYDDAISLKQGCDNYVTAWSDILRLGWLPELRFYEQKTALVKMLRKTLGTSMFRIDPDEVAVLVRPQLIEVEVAFNGLSIRSRKTTLGDSEAKSLLGSVINLLRPEASSHSAQFQHVLPIAGNYAEITRQAAERVVGIHLSRLRKSDFALLFDADTESEGLRFQAEFGVVSKAELPARLSRQRGRMSHGEAEGPIPPLFEDSEAPELPEVALFVDSYWYALKPPEGAVLSEAIFRFWSDTRQMAETTSQELRAGVLGDSG